MEQNAFWRLFISRIFSTEKIDIAYRFKPPRTKVSGFLLWPSKNPLFFENQIMWLYFWNILFVISGTHKVKFSARFSSRHLVLGKSNEFKEAQIFNPRSDHSDTNRGTIQKIKKKKNDEIIHYIIHGQNACFTLNRVENQFWVKLIKKINGFYFLVIFTHAWIHSLKAH